MSAVFITVNESSQCINYDPTTIKLRSNNPV